MQNALTNGEPTADSPADVFDYDPNLSFGAGAQRCSRADDTDFSKRKRLEDLLAGLPSATSRADVIGVLRSRLVNALAKGNGYDSIIYGDSTTRLAERTLSETAKGKGGAIPWLTADGQSPHDVQIVYLMRDLLRKEITAFATMTILPLTPLLLETNPRTTALASSKATTIEDLMGQYFESVEQNYPSIVANVVRTSSRLAAPPTESEERRLCRICTLPLAKGTGGLHWSGEQESPHDPVPNDSGNAAASLCYGCARSVLNP
ncbi:MAG: hypothetical protein Q9225_005293 [Loekoesia sp. 1 TL-2023]